MNIKNNDYIKEDMSKLSDRELAERTLAELNDVNKNLVQIDKHIWWVVPILGLIALILITMFPPLWLR
jgi:hypothetical protein